MMSDSENIKKKSIVYYAVNQERILNQALLSITSLFQKMNLQGVSDTQVIVYTDKPEYFKDYFKEGSSFLVLESLDKKTQEEWMTTANQGSKNIHRIKIRCILETFQKYTTDAVVLLDADTILIESLDTIFEKIKLGNTFLDRNEGCIFKGKTYGLKQHKDFLKKNRIQFNGVLFEWPEDQNMYNAGFVGVGRQHLQLLRDALHFHDLFYEQTKYYNAEQLTLSYFFQHKTSLSTVNDVILHWWFFKEFQQIVDKYIQSHKQMSFQDLLLTKLPTHLCPSYKEYKSILFKMRYKLRRELLKYNLVSSDVYWYK